MQKRRRDSLIVIVFSILVTLTTFGGLDQLYRSGSLNIPNDVDGASGKVNNAVSSYTTGISVGNSTKLNSALAEQ